MVQKYRSLNFQSLWTPVLMLLCAFLLVNCGQGGKARYEFSLLSEDQVLDQFAKADTAAKRANVIARIRNGGIQPNFSFGKLWSNPQAVNMCQNLEDESMRALLGTADQSCNRRDFHQFVELILACDKHYDFVIGEVRRCGTSLSPRLIMKIASRLEEGGVPEATVNELQESSGVDLVEYDPSDDPVNNVEPNLGPIGDFAAAEAMVRREDMIAAGRLPGRGAIQHAPRGQAWEVPPKITLLCNEFEAADPELDDQDWLEAVCELPRPEVHQIRRELFRRGDTDHLERFKRLRKICRSR